MKPNQILKKQKYLYLFTFSPIGLGDPFIRNICHTIVSAYSEKEALRKFILNDKGKLLDLFFRFRYDYGDNETKKFPQGETKHYYDRLVNLKLLPENKGDWDYGIIMIEECCEGEEEEFMKPYQQFLSENIETLIPYMEGWNSDGREFRIYEIKKNEYLM